MLKYITFVLGLGLGLGGGVLWSVNHPDQAATIAQQERDTLKKEKEALQAKLASFNSSKPADSTAPSPK